MDVTKNLTLYFDRRAQQCRWQVSADAVRLDEADPAETPDIIIYAAPGRAAAAWLVAGQQTAHKGMKDRDVDCGNTTWQTAHDPETHEMIVVESIYPGQGFPAAHVDLRSRLHHQSRDVPETMYERLAG